MENLTSGRWAVLCDDKSCSLLPRRSHPLLDNIPSVKVS